MDYSMRGTGLKVRAGSRTANTLLTRKVRARAAPGGQDLSTQMPEMAEAKPLKKKKKTQSRSAFV